MIATEEESSSSPAPLMYRESGIGVSIGGEIAPSQAEASQPLFSADFLMDPPVFSYINISCLLGDQWL